VFKKIKPLFKVLEWAIVVVLLGILGLIISPSLPFKNVPKSFAVVSGSMEPAIKTGSVVFTHTVDLKTIKKGDIIAFTSPSNSKDTILHRVDSIKTTDPLTFSTKGDANNSPDAWDVMDVGVKGVYFGAIPFLGYIADYVKKPLGFGIVVGIPALLFIISQLLSIKKAINEEVDRKVAKALETKKKTKPIENNIKSLIIFIVLFSSLVGLSTLQAIKASFNSIVTINGVSLSVVDFIPPSTPTGLEYILPTVACGGATNSRTITPDWNDSIAHGSKYIDHYEYESFNPPDGWMWGPVDVTASQVSGAFTVGEGTYGFRVRAVDNLGYVSDWTSVDFATSCQITYSLPTPPAPSLVSPTNNSILNTNGLVMDWTDVAGNYHNPLYYIYQSALNPGFSPVVYTSVHLTTSQIPAPGTPDGNYWWHVKTCDALDNCSDWSEAWQVTVDSTAPASVITLPVNSGSNSVVDSASWDGTVAGTATDNLSGINHVDLSVHRASGNTYWNGSSWTVGSETTVRVTATGKANWTYIVSDHSASTTYTITSHSVDNSGNIEDSYILTIVVPIPNPTITPTLSPTPEISPTPTPTAESSPEPVPSPTPTPTPTPTELPTATPTETPTPTPDETATPSPTPEPNPTSDLLTSGTA
jgi:signal peptidase I